MFENVRSKSTVNENVTRLTDYEIVKLSQAVAAGCIKTKVMGYIKSKDVGYGSSILLVLDNKKMVSLPKRYTNKFSQLSDSDIDMLKSGTMEFVSVDEFDTPKGKTCGFTLKLIIDNNESFVRF